MVAVTSCGNALLSEKSSKSQHVTLYNDFIFSLLTSFRLWLQKRGSVLSTRMYSSSAINIKPSEVIRK